MKLRIILLTMLVCCGSFAQGVKQQWATTNTPIMVSNITAFIGRTNLNGTTIASNLWDSSNVKFWGALGNGVHDDTSAISNAVRHAVSIGGGIVYFPAGMYSNTVPINLVTNGINIIGEAPTIQYVTNVAADASTLSPLGGTWINCGGTNFLTGYGLRGLSVEGIGLTNFYTAFTFGSNGVEGASFSLFRNIIGIGRATVNQSEMGIENYNSLFCRIDSVKFYNVNIGLRLVSQNNFVPVGNSLISDFYVFTYPKSVANGNNAKAGIQIQGLTPASGTAQLNNLITLVRPQVNSFNGDGTGKGILLQGASSAAGIANVEVADSDIEGNLLYSIYADQCYNSHFRIMASAAVPGMVFFAVNGYNNMVDSCDGATIATNTASGPNVFNGVYSPLSTTNAMNGVYMIAGVNTLTAFTAVKGGSILSGSSGYTSPNIDGTGTASYHPGGVYTKGSVSYLYSTATIFDGFLEGSAGTPEWLISKSGSSYFNGGSVGIGNTAPAAKLDVTGDIRALTTITATNSFMLPTNYVAANFVPVAGMVKICSSNGVLWKVTQLTTNLLSANTP